MMDFASMLPTALMLFFPVGLILLLSSAMPVAYAPAMVVRLLLTWATATLAYFSVGFAFQFGGIAQVSADPALSGLYWEWYPLDQSVDPAVARLWGVIALSGWFLSGPASTPGAVQLFLSHAALVGVAAVLPVAALHRRLNFWAALGLGLLVGGLVYPIPGNWLWGGGWLANLGLSVELGHGFVDIGGASLVFLSAAIVTLVGLLLLRPPAETPGETSEIIATLGVDHHVAVYDDFAPVPDATTLPVKPMPPVYLPILGILGAGLILLGWLGVAGVSHIPTAQGLSAAHIAAAGILGAFGAALSSAVYSWLTTHTADILMTGRAILAGLVITGAGGALMPLWMAVIAGLVAGLSLPFLLYFFNEKTRLRDDFGVLTACGLAGLIGGVLPGLLADGRAGAGWNGVESTAFEGVAGLIVGGGAGQLQAQLLGLASVAVWGLLVSLLFFQLIRLVEAAQSRRTSPASESDPAPTDIKPEARP